ncbi:unnamed protein product [Closterium sp. NIES-54]
MQVGRHVELRGWVRTVRSQKAFSFIELNDGSSLSGIQVVATPEIEGYQELGGRHFFVAPQHLNPPLSSSLRSLHQVEGGGITTGAAVSVEGEVVESQGKGQKIEIKAQKLTLCLVLVSGGSVSKASLSALCLIASSQHRA